MWMIFFYWNCVRSDKFRGGNNSVFKQRVTDFIELPDEDR